MLAKCESILRQDSELADFQAEELCPGLEPTYLFDIVF
jgi:hypothetical protein